MISPFHSVVSPIPSSALDSPPVSHPLLPSLILSSRLSSSPPVSHPLVSLFPYPISIRSSRVSRADGGGGVVATPQEHIVATDSSGPPVASDAYLLPTTDTPAAKLMSRHGTPMFGAFHPSPPHSPCQAALVHTTAVARKGLW